MEMAHAENGHLFWGHSRIFGLILAGTYAPLFRRWKREKRRKPMAVLTLLEDVIP